MCYNGPFRPNELQHHQTTLFINSSLACPSHFPSLYSNYGHPNRNHDVSALHNQSHNPCSNFTIPSTFWIHKKHENSHYNRKFTEFHHFFFANIVRHLLELNNTIHYHHSSWNTSNNGWFRPKTPKSRKFINFHPNHPGNLFSQHCRTHRQRNASLCESTNPKQHCFATLSPPFNRQLITHPSKQWAWKKHIFTCSFWIAAAYRVPGTYLHRYSLWNALSVNQFRGKSPKNWKYVYFHPRNPKTTCFRHFQLGRWHGLVTSTSHYRHRLRNTLGISQFCEKSSKHQKMASFHPKITKNTPNSIYTFYKIPSGSLLPPFIIYIPIFFTLMLSLATLKSTSFYSSTISA